jgi:hypothetical protein
MTIKLVFVFALLTCSRLVTYSQFKFDVPVRVPNANEHRKLDVMLTVSPNMLINTPNGIQAAGGFKLQIFLNEHISADADIVLGNEYIHTGPGIIGLPLGLLASVIGLNGLHFEESLFLLGFIALSVEHTSYHIPVSNDMDISPFISFLRYKVARPYSYSIDPLRIDEQLSFATGVQINKYFGRFMLSPYAEYNIGYKDHLSGANVGVYFGVNLGRK